MMLAHALQQTRTSEENRDDTARNISRSIPRVKYSPNPENLDFDILALQNIDTDRFSIASDWSQYR
jgi:hypothetical protein